MWLNLYQTQGQEIMLQVSLSVADLHLRCLYGEAQSAESRDDFIHKMKIILKELKESRGLSQTYN
jgi:hypothetical protein